MENVPIKTTKKTYQPPKLVEYGSVQDMTRNMATGSNADNSGNKMSTG